jgi:hypothetical protein
LLPCCGIDRSNAFELIQSQLLYRWQQTQKLPKTLNELADPLSGFIVPNDPETNMPYEYTAQGSLTFELCANFAMPMETTMTMKGSIARPTYPGDSLDANFEHQAGRTCFERTIDPSIHKPFTKGI